MNSDANIVKDVFGNVINIGDMVYAVRCVGIYADIQVAIVSGFSFKKKDGSNYQDNLPRVKLSPVEGALGSILHETTKVGTRNIARVFALKVIMSFGDIKES